MASLNPQLSSTPFFSLPPIDQHPNARSPSPQPNDPNFLSFDDGAVIIKTSKYQLQLHRGVLAMECLSFDEAFDETPLLVVDMVRPPIVYVEEDSKLIYHFFMALYNVSP